MKFSKRLSAMVVAIAMLVTTAIPGFAFAGTAEQAQAKSGSEPIPAEQQMYAFNYGSVENVGSDGLITFCETPQPMQTVSTDVNSDAPPYLYFAVKDGDNYYAVDTVNSPGHGIEVVKAFEDEAYCVILHCYEIVKYRFSAIYQGREYFIDVNSVLGNGFFSSKAHTEEAHISNDTLHFVDAEEKNADGTESYFYYMGRNYGEDRSAWSVRMAEIVNGYPGDAITGVTVSYDDTVVDDTGTFDVWKITVTNEYVKPAGDFNLAIVFNENDEERRVTIYDSTETPAGQKVHFSSDATVESDGKITLYGDPLTDCYCEEWTGFTGYFFVQVGNEYYAVKPDATGIDGLEITYPYEDDPYCAQVNGEKGIYRLPVEYQGKEYYLDINIEAASGFFTERQRSKESYIANSELHFIDAKEKNADGTESYFYYIRKNDGEDSSGWSVSIEDSGSRKPLEGVDVRHDGTLTYGSETFDVWKITVTNEYVKPTGNVNQVIVFNEIGAERWVTIYDSTETPAGQRVYYSAIATVASDGKITFDGDPLSESYCEEWKGFVGFFFVKVGNEYYAVKPDATGIDGLEITYPYEDDPYCAQVNGEKGTYRLPVEYQGKEYYLDIDIGVASGCFTERQYFKESYIANSELHFIDAKEKNADGTESYFYYMWKNDGEDRSGWSVSIDEGGSRKPLEGVTVSYDGTLTDGPDTFDVWKITVTNEYVKPQGNESSYIVFNEYFERDSVSIYDSTEITPSQRMYFFNSVTVDSDGKVTLEGDGDPWPGCRFEEWTGSEGYFFVQVGNEYYAVKPDATVIDGLEITYPDEEYDPYYAQVNGEKGTYRLPVEYQGKEYYLDINIEAEQGFFTEKQHVEASYIYSQRLYFADAKEKNTDGTESYFYYMWKNDGEDRSGWSVSIEEAESRKPLEGVTVSYDGTLTDGSDTFDVWKVTVKDTYVKPSENVYYGLCFNGGYYWEGIEIYGSTEISHGQQMYFAFSNMAEVESDGKVILSEAPLTDCYCEAWKGCKGFFFVQVGNEYYAVKPDATGIEGLEITYLGEEYDTYYAQVNGEKGTYRLSVEYQGKEYHLDINIGAANGFFTERQHLKESYIDNNALHFVDAKEKNADGTESYFYYMWKNDGEDRSTWPVRIAKTRDGAPGPAYPGVTVSYDGTLTDGSDTFDVWKITITSEYVVRPGEGDTAIVFNESDERSNLTIFDSTEISKRIQMYFAYSGTATVESDGKITFDEDSIVGCYAQELYEVEGYFFVQVGDEYYAVKPDAAGIEGLEITYPDEESDPYRTHVKGKEGTYRLSAEYQGKTYFIDVTISTTDGFFKEKQYLRESHIDNGELHFVDAKEKNASGTESYFYYMQSEELSEYFIEYFRKHYGEDRDISEITAGIYESELGATRDNAVSGISVCYDGKLEAYRETLDVWKITVTNEYVKENRYIEFCLLDSNQVLAYTSIDIYGADEQRAECSHPSTVTVEAKEATCTEDGYTGNTVCSECGEVITIGETIPAKGHDWGEEFNRKEPTCTEQGSYSHTCGRCKTTENVVVDALGHTEVTDAAVEATCTETGLTEGKHCFVCNEVLIAQKTVSALGHTEKTAPGYAATCTENGLTDGVMCSVCGETIKVQEVIPVIAHNYTSVVTKPTCTTDGYTIHTCSACGSWYKDNIVAASGHKEVTDAAVKPTLDKTGLTAGKHCSVCGKVTVAQKDVDMLKVSAPTGVKAASAGYSSIKISWSKVTGASGYVVYRSTSKNGTYTAVANKTDLSYTNSGRTTGTTYYYKVRAYRTVSGVKKYGNYSSVVYAKAIPAVPTNVKAASAGYSSIKISWGKVTGATGYTVYRSTSKSGKYSAVANTTKLSYTNSGRTTGKTYYYKVRAYRTISGAKKYGNYSSIVYAKPIPAKPVITAKNAGSKKIKITWKKVAGATGYEVYRATSKSGKYSRVTTIAKSSAVSYTNTKLTRGKTYFYKVRAYRTVSGKKVYGSYSSVKYAKG